MLCDTPDFPTETIFPFGKRLVDQVRYSDSATAVLLRKLFPTTIAPYKLDSFCNRSTESPVSGLIFVSSCAGFTLLFVVAAVGATFWAVRWWV